MEIWTTNRIATDRVKPLGKIISKIFTICLLDALGFKIKKYFENVTEMRLKYKGSRSMRNGVYFALTNPGELPVDIEESTNAVEFDKMTHITIQINQVPFDIFFTR